MTSTIAAVIVVGSTCLFAALLAWERHQTPRAPEDGRCPPTHGA
jgi:hypothetical protein